MKKFYIKTLGCKTNQLESAIIEEKLQENNFQKVDSIEECDLFILNSCSVTHTTDNDALKLINSVKALNSNIFVVLTGCFAQLQVEELKNTANGLFDEIEEKSREMQLAESAVVYANRDRYRQMDVDQQLNSLESSFFTGEFNKVYRDANAIYHRNHVEEANNE